MTSSEINEAQILDRIGAGDHDALAEAFNHHRDRLRRMVELRLDRRLRGRVDADDVLQEAYLDIDKRFMEFAADPAVSFFVWLRFLTIQKLLEVHRRHLGTRMRNAAREVSLNRSPVPQASSINLAAQLLGDLTSASQAAMRSELRSRLQEALDSLDVDDREVLALRHFEELSNNETAEVLGLSPSAASNRYIRALKRLKPILAKIPGLV